MGHGAERAIVVGGGLCGLATAALLARAGTEVELLEAAGELGGRARTADVDGFLLNQGAHAVYVGGPGTRVLAGLGIGLDGRRPSTRAGRLLRDGRLEGGPLGPLAARDWAPAARALGRLPRAEPGESAAAWVARASGGERARSLLAASARTATYCADFAAVPAEVAHAQVRLATRVRYLHGGWAVLVEALARAARSAGAGLRTRARVAELLADPRRPGVRLAGDEELRGDVVVLAGLTPSAVARLVADAGATPPAVATAPRPATVACLDVALRRLPRDLSFVLGLDRPLFLTVQSRAARLAPAGGAVVHVVGYPERIAGGAPGTAVSRAALEDVLELAEPGWREHAVDVRYLPRMVAVGHVPEPREGLAGRPGVGDAGLPRVLLAGDWVGPEGWLSDAALASAARAADAARLRSRLRVLVPSPDLRAA